jgi:hypothetical protein
MGAGSLLNRRRPEYWAGGLQKIKGEDSRMLDTMTAEYWTEGEQQLLYCSMAVHYFGV